MEDFGEEDRSPDFMFIVEAEEGDRRLDTFLRRQRRDVSRSRFQKLIRDALVLINDRPAKPGYEVRAGDRVTVWLPPPDLHDSLSPQPMPLEILYEDEDILVVNKAPGVVVHPGAGHYDGTLVHGLLAHCSRLASQGAPLRPGIVHRLDRDTSGAMVVAKSDRAYLDLVNQFKEHAVEKEYLALAYGRFPRESGEINAALDRHPVDRKKMAVAERKGREAITRWSVEKEWGEVSLLRVRIETGRTHQIRAHLSYIQHPIVGDAVYGGGSRKAKTIRSHALQGLLAQADRQMLHSWKLGFAHPLTHESLRFTAEIPSDFSSLISRIEQVSSSEGM